MKQYAHIHGLVFNKPHLCTPAYAETVLAVLKERVGLEGSYDILGEAKEPKKPFLTGGLQTIPILGSMVHRGGSMDALSGTQSYQSIQTQIQEALDNSQVKSILLEMDSPGGSVAGLFDLKDFILKAKEQKPIYAIANDEMASAAYLIGSACTKVYATQTSGVGSIGVVAMHMDRSEQNKKEGLKPTFVYAGSYKVAGNPHAPLEGEALSYLQESVMDSYEMFVKAVAENRSLDESVIRSTEARVYRGEKAKELGLVDEVMSMDSLLEKLASNNVSQQRGTPMSKGMNMDKDTTNTLEADFAQASASLETARDSNEKLTKALIDNGFKITANGIFKPEEEAKEYLEYNGSTIDLSVMPEAAASALKELALKDQNANLEKAASAMLPNFSLSVAMELVSANLSDEVMQAMKAADKMYESLMEETGESVVEADMSDPKELMDAMITSYMDEHGVDRHKARVEVVKTSKGREIQKALLKG